MAEDPIHTQITRERERRGWTQTELGKRAGVSGKLIWKIEHGGATTINSLRAVAAALGCDYNGRLISRSQPGRDGLLAAVEAVPDDLVGSAERILRALDKLPSDHLDLLLGIVKIFEEDPSRQRKRDG